MIELHRGQSQIISDLFLEKTCRYAVACASRGFGKSYLAGISAIMAAQELTRLPESVPNKNVAIIAPTHSQVQDIYYPLLAYQFGLEELSIKHSRAYGKFWLPNNVELRLWSYEASERMRGTGQYFVVLDEVTSWEQTGGLNLQESWESIIQPCVTTRWSPKNAERLNAPSPGRALVISTPKGHNYFYDMFNMHTVDDEWKSYHYTYRDSPYLDDDEIARVKAQLDPLKFSREYEASFEDSGATVFYCFDRKEHIDKTLEDFQEGEDVHIAIDFNIGIMASVVFAVRGNQIHIIDELQGHNDTETLAKDLIAKYKGHKIISYPDPAGRARKTSAVTGVTDFSILERHKIATRAHKKAPPISDSVNAVNKKLKNANGDIEMFIHPRCTNTIRSLERTSWVERNPDSATIDKKEGVEHWTDGLRYAVEYLYPIRRHNKATQRGFMF